MLIGVDEIGIHFCVVTVSGFSDLAVVVLLVVVVVVVEAVVDGAAVVVVVVVVVVGIVVELLMVDADEIPSSVEVSAVAVVGLVIP